MIVEGVQCNLEGLGVVIWPGEPPDEITDEYMRREPVRVFARANERSVVHEFERDEPHYCWKRK